MLTICYLVTFIAMGIGEAILGPTLPTLAQQTTSSIGEISFLFTAIGLGHMIGAFGGGSLYDHLQGHWVTIIMLFSIALVFFFMPGVSSLWLLTGLIFLLGIAQGTMDVGINTLLLWIHEAASAPYLNALQFFFGIGAFLCPLIIAQSMLQTGSVQAAYWIAALSMLPPAIWLITLKPPRKREPTPEERTLVAQPGLVAIIAVFLMLYIGTLIGFSGWLYTLITTDQIMPPEQAAYLVSAFWGALTLGRLIMIPISSRVKPISLLYFDVLGCMLSIVLFILFRDLIPMIWVTTILMGLFIASVFPSTIAHANQYLSMTGKVTGLLFVGGNAGTMIIPWILGQIFAQWGGSAVPIAILLDLLLTFALLILLSTYSKKLPLRS
jgi:FHS family Na+ dependent glucose MFS transporter 1